MPYIYNHISNEGKPQQKSHKTLVTDKTVISQFS